MTGKEGHMTKMGPIRALPWDSYTDAGKKILPPPMGIKELSEDAEGHLSHHMGDICGGAWDNNPGRGK